MPHLLPHLCKGLPYLVCLTHGFTVFHRALLINTVIVDFKLNLIKPRGVDINRDIKIIIDVISRWAEAYVLALVILVFKFGFALADFRLAAGYLGKPDYIRVFILPTA